MVEMIKKFYSLISKGYNKLYYEEQIKKLKIIKKLVGNKIKPLLLDIGCGTGISTDFFGIKAVGIDPSLEMLKEFNSKNDKVCGICEHLPFKNETFKTIISITAIHNFKNIDKAIDEIKRVAKKDAFFIFTLLKRSKKFKTIKKILEKNFNLEEFDEGKDLILFGKLID